MTNLLLIAAKNYQKVNIGDLKFYLIASILVVALIVILSVFSKSKRFKAHKRKKSLENKEVYVTPNIIKVGKSDINKEISENGENSRESKITEQEKAQNV
ncbi:MAG: hypothetical protein K2O95_07035 [Clostridia bacterium]|nr:hypothetical protein [Clostridia bacterium]MDE7079850.1 hypothetical protein [Clostridia bacterium]